MSPCFDLPLFLQRHMRRQDWKIENQNKITTHKNKTNIPNTPDMEYKCWALISTMTLETTDSEVIMISDSGQRPWVETNGGNS